MITFRRSKRSRWGAIRNYSADARRGLHHVQWPAEEPFTGTHAGRRYLQHTTYDLDPQARLAAVRERFGDTYTLDTDAAGNTTRVADLELARDARGRPARDLYDADGRRLLSPPLDVNTHRLVHDDEGLVATIQNGGRRRYLPPLPGFQLSKSRFGAWELALLLPDASPLAVVEPDGDVLKTSLYDPFGLPEDEQHAEGLDYLKSYAGYLRYPTRGARKAPLLLDAGHRLYAPSLGRFLSPDPVPPNPSDPRTLDRYAANFANPAVYTDPDGALPQLAGAGIGGIIGGALGCAAGAIGELGCIKGTIAGAVAGAAAGATLGWSLLATEGAIASGGLLGKAAIAGNIALAGKVAGTYGGFATGILTGGGVVEALRGGAFGGAIGLFAGLTGGTVQAALGGGLLAGGPVTAQAVGAELLGAIAGDLATQIPLVNLGLQPDYNFTQSVLTIGGLVAPGAVRAAGRVPAGLRSLRLGQRLNGAVAGVRAEFDDPGAATMFSVGQVAAKIGTGATKGFLAQPGAIPYGLRPPPTLTGQARAARLAELRAKFVRLSAPPGPVTPDTQLAPVEVGQLALLDRRLGPTVEIEFPAAGLSEVDRALFTRHLREQEVELNALSLHRPDDLELNLLNFKSNKKLINRARRRAGRFLPAPRPKATSGASFHAGHALDSVAGGYVWKFVGFRHPVQSRIGALWATRRTQIQPGSRHKLTPIFLE